MNEPRKLVFGFLWPKPDPHHDLDHGYRQVRGVRVAPRGPIRIGMLVIASLAEIAVLGAALGGAVASGVSVISIAGGAVAATGLVLLLRAWVVGTFVNDESLRVETMFRRVDLPWSSIEALTDTRRASPVLGLPIHIAARAIAALPRTGGAVRTHVYATSPDFWLRPEAYDIAARRLHRWLPRHGDLSR